MTALFLDREQKIRVNEFPELLGLLTCPNENKGNDCWPDNCRCDKVTESYESALQSALDTGILCEDQEEAKLIMWKSQGDKVMTWEPMKPYRVNYRMEVKKAMSCGFEGENLCALNENDCPNHLHGTCQEKKLATLIPII